MEKTSKNDECLDGAFFLVSETHQQNLQNCPECDQTLPVKGPAFLKICHAPCLVLVHFAASTYTDESIMRIHCLECSRVKVLTTLRLDFMGAYEVRVHIVLTSITVNYRFYRPNIYTLLSR